MLIAATRYRIELRLLITLLKAGITVSALHILLILFLGGEPSMLTGIITPRGWEIAFSTMVLLLLILLHCAVMHPLRLREGLSSHPVTILFACCTIIYLANGRTLGASDTMAARSLPLSILRQGNFALNEFPSLYREGPYLTGSGELLYPSGLKLVHGRYVSTYPVGAALLTLPFYFPSAMGPVDPESLFLFQLEKLAAAVITALSVTVLYLTLRYVTGQGYALLIAVIYALGTSSLSVSSQALWQHGPSQLALTAGLYCLVRGQGEPRWVGWAGFPLTFAVVCRPTDAVAVLLLGIYVGIYHRSAFGKFILTGLPPVLFQLWYNTTYFDDPLRTQFPFIGTFWHTPFWQGFSGLLMSPSRGLFVYSPIFLFAVVGMGRAWGRHGNPLLRYVSIGTFLTVLLYSKWVNWWGGGSFGPRLLADLTPLLALSLVSLKDVLARQRGLAGVFVVCAVWSIGAHAIGAFWDDGRWNASPPIDASPQRLWSWQDNQLVNPLRAVFARSVIALRSLPTSRTAPARLSATYRATLQPMLPVSASQYLLFASVDAINTGDAVWLAWASAKQGTVQLGWRWQRGGHELLARATWSPFGYQSLRYDVFPEQSHDFLVLTFPPPEPGTYLLEIGLLSGQGTRFSDLGSPPVRVVVTVDAVAPPRLTLSP